MLTLFTDLPITRRKKRHYVLDENSTIVYAPKDIADALNWCLEMGHQKLRIAGDQETRPGQFIIWLERYDAENDRKGDYETPFQPNANVPTVST